MNKIFFLFLLALSFATQAQKIKNLQPYFQTNSRLGYVVVTYPIEYSGTNGIPMGKFGLSPITWKTKAGGKYDSALNVIEPEVNPSQKLQALYADLYNTRGKKITLVKVNFDTTFSVCKKAPAGGKFYHEQDLRFLKEKLQIDELLIVIVRYGLSSQSRYGIEVTRSGFASVDSQIINLRDNSIFMSQDSNASNLINGAWNTPPAYENLKDCVSKAIEKVIEKEKKKYDW